MNNLIEVCRRSLVINHFQELFWTDGNAAVVFIYCNYKAQHTILQLMGALLKQLALHRLSPGSIEILQRDHKEKERRPSLETLITLLETEFKTYSRVFIVIDALDEHFPDEDRMVLLEKLRVLTVVSPAKLMVTSRDILSIDRAIRADIQLETQATESDIRSYIDGRILKNTMLKRLVTKLPSIGEKVVGLVVERAQGMYVVTDLPFPPF